MKRTILLSLVMIVFITSTNAQKKQKQQTGYAITAQEKGGRSWKEVRLVNTSTGDPIKSIYQSTDESEALNARTGKPVIKKTVNPTTRTLRQAIPGTSVDGKKVVNLDAALAESRANNPKINITYTDPNGKTITTIEDLKVNINPTVTVDPSPNVNNNVNVNTNTRVRSVVMVRSTRESGDKPFATNSAACAYDKKHDRLYYTPMAINQLRYIDLKSNKIYYFEDEAFGAVKGLHDAANQITRMTMGSDGHGYALSNDANHLVRFTTGKNPVITDLGPLSDDVANTRASIHSGGGFGGDMIADNKNNLYLITAGRQVYQISIETKVAKHLGTITGLPKGFSTNGAMVEDGSSVIIASSESTVGYYRFDLASLKAEKVSASPDVFNAADLANGNLANLKKKKKDKPEETEEVVTEEPKAAEEPVLARSIPANPVINKGINIYPNPVTDGNFRLSFADQPAGKYQVQVIDMAGKLITSREVNIGSKIQVEQFNVSDLTSGGTYLVKITSTKNNISVTNKLIVQ